MLQCNNSTEISQSVLSGVLIDWDGFLQEEFSTDGFMVAETYFVVGIFLSLEQGNLKSDFIKNTEGRKMFILRQIYWSTSCCRG